MLLSVVLRYLLQQAHRATIDLLLAWRSAANLPHAAAAPAVQQSIDLSLIHI